jgi:hypothetical protein
MARATSPSTRFSPVDFARNANAFGAGPSVEINAAITINDIMRLNFIFAPLFLNIFTCK